MNSKGDSYYENTEDCDDFVNPEWYCKECNHTICKTEEEAIKFLKNG